MSDEEMLMVIAAVCDFDRTGVERWRTEALIIGRAVEREALERAAKICDQEAADSKRHRLHEYAAGANICADSIRMLMKEHPCAPAAEA